MSFFARHRRCSLALALVALALIIVSAALPRVVRAVDPNPVVAAWERARVRGSYHFASDVVQVATPIASLANVGKRSRQDRLYLEGDTNLSERRLELRLWLGGGSVADEQSALAIRVEDGKTWVREGLGAWKESRALTELIAPEGDLLAYLSAVRDVRTYAPEQRAGIAFTRYSFQIDGPTFASYMRGQAEAAMRQQGSLPPGMELQSSEYYNQMAGDGELWVAADGLPLRQTLNLRFPERGSETTSAQISVDFSRFSPQPSSLSWLSGLSRGMRSLGSEPAPLLSIALAAGMAYLLIRHWRSRRLRRGLSAMLVVMLTLSPVLQNAQTLRFFDAQSATAAEQQQQQAQRTAAEHMRDALAKPDFDPHADPVAAATRAEPARVAANEASASPFAARPALIATQVVSQTDDGADDDHDGLSNYLEQRLGTDQESADSDGDTITDTLEIQGFQYAGKTWRTNPQELDSNGDTKSDGEEWLRDNNGDGLPDDTDGDRTPDLFDDDDDGDGVPDQEDINPTRQSGQMFGETMPLSLTVKGLAREVPLQGGKASDPSRLTYVDFQLRPQNQQHLWYAYNVLDWPEDHAGQMQDGDSKTYADLPRAPNAAEPPASESFGDMKLLPMLEIRIAGAANNLPAEADLRAYNIATNELDADDNGVPDGMVAYVPLTVVVDQETGARVAFGGRMPYRTDAAWAPQQVRLVWAAQMLVDWNCRTSNSKTVCDKYNQPQIMQTYYDSWVLTGLNVREDHGVKFATIYEDPQLDGDLDDDAGLWLLSHGLDNSFLPGRDADGDGRRDVTVEEIHNRFDHAANGAPAGQPLGDAGWAIPNTLTVAQSSADHLDLGVGTLAMTDTTRFLDGFNSRWSESNQIKPLLMFAHEAGYRAIGLDAAAFGAGYVSQQQNALTIDLQPVGQEPIKAEVNTGLKWTSYCHKQQQEAGPNWAPCAPDAYWQELDQRHDAAAGQPGDSELMKDGRMMVAHLYYLSLAQGLTHLVERDGRLIAGLYSLKSDPEYAGWVRSAAGGGRSVVTAVANVAFMAHLNNQGLLEYLGTYLKVLRGTPLPLQQGKPNAKTIGDVVQRLKRFFASSAGKVTLIVAGVAILTIGIFAVLHFATSSGEGSGVGTLVGQILLKTVIVGITLILSVVLPFSDLVTKAVAIGGSFRAGFAQAARLSPAVTNTARATAVVGAVIAIAITVGFFIYSVVSNGIQPGSPEFNHGLAETIAATIYAVFLAVLAATLIGLIIVGVIGVIDLILTSICELGVDQLRNVPGLGGACFTIGTAATKGLAKLIYSYDLMVDLEHKTTVDGKDVSDLVVSGSPELRLANKQLGYLANNQLFITLPLTTTAVHKDPVPENWNHILPYLWFYSEDNLRSSTFRYSMTRSAEDIKVNRDEMTNEWQDVRPDHNWLFTDVGDFPISKAMYRGQAYGSVTLREGITLKAGINRTAPFYLNMGYAVPAYECWTAPQLNFIPICYKRQFDGHTSTYVDSLKLDIFPDTIDGFMAMVDKGDGGRVLAWDPAFPSLWDADNDGLISSAHGGIDNDASWDSDGDGLSDKFEQDRRAAGIQFSPAQRDTDNDGLDDKLEAALGTDPARDDSDNDGLKDGAEVYLPGLVDGGWDITIGGVKQPDGTLASMTVHVSSDPTLRDTDGDGIPDGAEKQLAEDARARHADDDNLPYHPRVFNRSPLQVDVAVDDVDGIVAPGQTVAYTTTVATGGQPFAPGVLQVSAPPALGGTHRQALDLPHAPISAQTNLTIAGTSGPAEIASMARARLQGTGGPEREWRIGAPTSTPLQTPPRSVDAASSTAGDGYLLVALTSQNGVQRDRGDIVLEALPGGQQRSLEEDDADRAFRRGTSPPSVTCNAAGQCPTVWDHYDNCGVIQVVDLSVDHAGGDGGGALEPVIFYTVDSRPEIELWEQDDVQGTIPINRPVPFCGGITFHIYESDSDNPKDDDMGTTRFTTDNTGESRLSFAVTDDGQVEQVHITFRTQIVHRYDVAGRISGPDGQPGVNKQFSLNKPGVSNEFVHDLRPVIAGDGSSFLAAWERVFIDGSDNATAQIVVRRFDGNGAQLSEPRIVAQDINVGQMAQNSPQSRLRMDLAWIGGRYRLAWKAIESHEIRTLDLDQGGAPIGGSAAIVTTSAGSGEGGAPSLAYNPAYDRTLLVYHFEQNGAPAGIAGRLYQGLDQGTDIGLWGANFQPRVVYYPAIKGWLLGAAQGYSNTTQYFFKPLTYDLQELPIGTWNPGVVSTLDWGLACPAPGSAPEVELRFEELPGATIYADSSGHARDAAGGAGAANPSAGAPAKLEVPAPPYSDYALEFDGIDDYATVPYQLPDAFSIAFWIKTSQQNAYLVDGLGSPGNGAVIAILNGRLVMATPGVVVQSSAAVADDNWHFVVATRSPAGGLQVYVDDAAGTPDGGIAQPLNAASDLRIGGLRSGAYAFHGLLDYLSIFSVALDQGAVTRLYNGGQQPGCLAAVAQRGAVPGEQTALTYSTLDLQQRDPRGAGPFDGSASLVLTVDGEPPTSRVTSLKDGALIQGTPSGPTTLIIGGEASDPTTRVTKVEVIVDGGAPQPAQDTATWTYALQLTEGVHTIQTRATDAAGNVETGGPSISVRVDATPPQLAIAPPPATPIAPRRGADGRWRVPLSGTVGDASGVRTDSVMVLAQGPALTMPNQEWQTATLAGDRWTIDYVLPAGVPDATGAYTITVRASDRAGNRTSDGAAVAMLRLDSAGPVAALDAASARLNVVKQPLAITGLVTDTGGLAGPSSLEIAYVPITHVVALSGTALLLSFDESPDAVWFADRTPQHNNAACATAPTCPAAVGRPQSAGRSDPALQFDGQSALRVPNAASLNFGENDSFSLQAWVFAAGGSEDAAQPLVVKGDVTSDQGYGLLIRGGHYAALALPGTSIPSGQDLRDGHWHHLAGVIDRASGQASLYVDGVLAGSAPVAGAAANDADLEIGGSARLAGKGFVGALDEVAIFDRALILEDIHALVENADLTWHSATLAQSGGRTTWSSTVPAGLEGQFQIDLRAADTLGNRGRIPNVWHGIIDTQAPRVTISATPTGAQYYDRRGKATRYEIKYTCDARDRHLKGESFDCAGNRLQPPDRTFDDDTALQGLFPDWTSRTGLTMTFYRWEPTTTPAATARACDIYDHCTSASTRPAPAQPTLAGSPSASGAPNAVIAGPTNQSVVTSSGVVSVTVAAEALQSLRQVTLWLDGAVVDTASFSQTAAVTNSLRIVTVAPAGEGDHTLRVQATDWAGAQSSAFAITFTLDLHKPEVVLNTTLLTNEDTYQVGSGVMRFSGVATDTIGLAAVQLRVGDGPFEDTTLADDGSWSTARWLGPATHGQSYRITVRAIDRAGTIGEDERTVLVNVEPPVPVDPAALPDTTITGRPSETSLRGAASFSFTGAITPAAPLAFECRLDAGIFEPCTSPQTYTLPDGTYTFEVRAIDRAGNADPTPASYLWTIVTGCASARPTISGTPGNDRIVGTPGTDIIFGGGGDDRIDGAGGDDLICGGDGADRIDGGAGADVVEGGAGGDTLIGGAGDDTLVGGAGQNTLRGGDGDDRLVGGAERDELRGGPGNDTLVGGTGDDLLDGANGRDTLDGGDGADTLRGGGGDDNIAGGDGADMLQGEAGRDMLDGGAGDDLLDGGDRGDVLLGGEGADRLIGGDGDDTLLGGGGPDRLEGGDDDDTLTGGAGADRFDGGGDEDTATDFNRAEGDRKSSVEHGG